MARGPDRPSARPLAASGRGFSDHTGPRPGSRRPALPVSELLSVKPSRSRRLWPVRNSHGEPASQASASSDMLPGPGATGPSPLCCQLLGETLDQAEPGPGQRAARAPTSHRSSTLSTSSEVGGRANTRPVAIKQPASRVALAVSPPPAGPALCRHTPPAARARPGGRGWSQAPCGSPSVPGRQASLCSCHHAVRLGHTAAQAGFLQKP